MPRPGGAGVPEEEMPRFHFTKRHALLLVFSSLAIVAFLYFVLPQLAGLDDTWNRIEQGDPWWLALAPALRAAVDSSATCAVPRGLCARGRRIDWRESYQITMAGLAATRLFAAGGAGGIALTAWALRRAGMAARTVALPHGRVPRPPVRRLHGALIVGGLGLRTGLFEGAPPFAMTVAAGDLRRHRDRRVMLVSLVPGDFERRLARWGRGDRGARSWAAGGWRPRRPRSPAACGTAIRLRASARPGAARRGRLVGLRHRRAVGVLPRVRRRAAGRRARHGLLRRHARQPAAAAGRHRGRGRRHDRRVRRLRRAVRPARSWPCSPTVGSRSGCPTLPGAIAYLQLRRTVARWWESERPARRA